jgi:hypothetical protein
VWLGDGRSREGTHTRRRQSLWGSDCRLSSHHSLCAFKGVKVAPHTHPRSPEVTLADPRANGACAGTRQHATFVLWAWRRRRAWTVRVPSAVGSGWGQTSSEPSRSYANSSFMFYSTQ